MGPVPGRMNIYSDEVLLHELVHAMSVLEGTSANETPFQHPKRQDMVNQFQNMEEFTATVITNVYRSEMGRPGIRMDYDVLEINPYKDNMSGQSFYSSFKEDMQQVCAIHPLVAKELKRAPNIPFNPFAFCEI